VKSKPANFIATLIALILVTAMIPVFAGDPSVPQDADAMWILDSDNSFDTGTTNPGYLFNVTVWLNMTTDVFCYQIALRYNRTHLKALRSGFTAGVKSQFMEGHTTSTSGPTIDTSFLGNGSVLAFESCYGEDNITAPQHGSLIWIEFEILAVPGKGETLTSKIDISTEYPTNTFVQDPDLDDIPITPYDADYTYEYADPSYNPNMAIEHDGFYGVPPASILPPSSWPVYWGPYPPTVIGSSFDAKIYIENLAAAWGLTSATFCLCYNTTVIDVIGGTANITLNTAVWNDTTSVITVTHDTPDEINFTVYPKAAVVPSGKVLVATVRFTIMKQEAVPPYPIGYYDKSDLDFCGVYLEDHVKEIPHETSKDGEVRILAIVALPMPWFEVDDILIAEYGEYALGEEFDVNVTIVNLDEHWYVIGIQFRLSFDPDLLELVSVTEGPFLQDERWNLYGTYFMSFEELDGMFGHHIAIGDLLSTNTTTGEYDQTQFPVAAGPNVTALVPPADPVVATIRFKVIDQEFCFDAENLTCGLDILPFWPPEDCHFIDRDINFIPTDTAKIVNGTYTVCGSFIVGRLIDVYGGATNRGYGAIPFPGTFGGQGVGGNMDLVLPQSVVYLFANVSYNHWPVQSKDVGFEIEGPYEQDGWTPENPVERDVHIVRKYSNRTSTGDCENPGGVAWIMFQMPWPCDNPEDYLGKYRVTATVEICGIVVTDVLWFDYYYLVEITKVTTGYAYSHCNDVEVIIEFRSKAQQNIYPVLFAVVLQDELETPVSYNYYNLTVGEAEFCHWLDYDPITITVHVEKWAFAGLAHIYVSAFDCDPTDISPITGQHGAPWLPTYGQGWPLEATVPEILILPY
jgi:hypothetical protein